MKIKIQKYHKNRMMRKSNIKMILNIGIIRNKKSKTKFSKSNNKINHNQKALLKLKIIIKTKSLNMIQWKK
jgi:hypothetical protein